MNYSELMQACKTHHPDIMPCLPFVLEWDHWIGDINTKKDIIFYAPSNIEAGQIGVRLSSTLCLDNGLKLSHLNSERDYHWVLTDGQWAKKPNKELS